MIVVLDNIFENSVSSIPLDFWFDFSGCEFNGVFPFTAPVKLCGCVKNETDIVKLEAVAEVQFSGVCDRCAGDVNMVLKVPVNHVLVSELNGDDNGDFIVVEGMRLDIEQLTLEDIYLYLPSKLLCSDDCKGICPQCGKNLNEGSCGCKKPIDPRFAALQQLLD